MTVPSAIDPPPAVNSNHRRNTNNHNAPSPRIGIIIRRSTTTTILAAFLVGCALLRPAAAQNCYYPNGKVSTTDAPCSADGGACCPLNWECLSNGLCYYKPENYYGRYTCTDQTWSDNCPEYCTKNNTAVGNEAILNCDDGSWCCDGDRSFDCCSQDSREEIDVAKGTTIASISKLSPPTAAPPIASSSATPTSRGNLPVPSSSFTTSRGSVAQVSPTTVQASVSVLGPSITSPSAPDSTTITTASTASDSTGGVSVITLILTTSVPSPTLAPSPPSSSARRERTIGIAVGIPVALIAILGLAFFLWRRRKQKRAAQFPNPSTSDRSPLTDMYAHQKSAVEADSFPVAVARDGGEDRKRVSELVGSVPTQYGPLPDSPEMSSRSGGSGSGTPAYGGNASPPGYSPPADRSEFARGSGGSGGTLVVVNGLPDVEERPEPQELPTEANDRSRFSSPPSLTPTRTDTSASYVPYNAHYVPPGNADGGKPA